MVIESSAKVLSILGLYQGKGQTLEDLLEQNKDIPKESLQGILDLGVNQGIYESYEVKGLTFYLMKV